MHNAQAVAAVVSLLLFLRIVYILASNPIGELGEELLYLRMREWKQAGFVVLAILLIEVLEHALPFIYSRGWIRAIDDILLIANTTQAFLLLLATLLSLLVLKRYTHRALDRRIRESMETLAYLEGQRRRRRASSERRDWPVEDEE